MILPRLKYDGKPELVLNGLQLRMKEQIEQKIDRGIYNFEEVDCPVCDSIQREPIGEKDRYGLFFPTNICTHCGLVYTSPRMNQDSYNQFYNDEYRKLYVGTDQPTKAFFEKQRRKGKRIYTFLAENNLIQSSSFSVLEVGCGAGGIIDFFREKGATVKGLDLGEEYIMYGREVHGLDLEAGTLSDIEVTAKPDLIIYSHILEHILDVRDEIEQIKKCAREDTILYVEVPGIKEIHQNYGMNILKYFQNAHTYHFTLESLKNLMGVNGFELIHGNQFVQSAFRKATQEIKAHSDYHATIEFIKKTEKNRPYYSFTKRALTNRMNQAAVKFMEVTRTRTFAKKLKSSFSRR